MLSLCIKNNQQEIIAQQQHNQEVYLAFKNRAYQLGDVIELTIDAPQQFVWVQVDEALAPSLLYLTETTWQYPVILEDEARRAYSPKLFFGERHYLRAWYPTPQELSAYRNVALNAHDQKMVSGGFPHAYANVETRNDSTFFARNAIDGMLANDNHGSYPYQSWGINQQADAAITIDFGRPVNVDTLALVLRSDYPHDSYWVQVTLAFSDGQTLQLHPTNQHDRQFFSFPAKTTTQVSLQQLIKHEDASPFPALTQIEVYGTEHLVKAGDSK